MKKFFPPGKRRRRFLQNIHSKSSQSYKKIRDGPYKSTYKDYKKEKIIHIILTLVNFYKITIDSIDSFLEIIDTIINYFLGSLYKKY